MKRFWSIVFLGLFIALTSNCHWFPDYKYTGTPLSYVAQPKIIPVYVDDDFSDNDRIQIDNAILQWNYVLNGWVILKVEDEHFKLDIGVIKQVLAADNGIMIFRTMSNATIVPRSFLSPEVTPLAWTEGNNHGIGGHKVFLIADELTNPVKLQGVTLHELGHALGSDHHHGQDSSLMDPNYDAEGNACVDQWSSQQVAKFQRIPADKMNYCVY